MRPIQAAGKLEEYCVTTKTELGEEVHNQDGDNPTINSVAIASGTYGSATVKFRRSRGARPKWNLVGGDVDSTYSQGHSEPFEVKSALGETFPGN